MSYSTQEQIDEANNQIEFKTGQIQKACSQGESGRALTFLHELVANLNELNKLLVNANPEEVEAYTYETDAVLS